MHRPMSTICSTFLKYSELGDPLQVLHKCTEPVGPIKSTEVLIKTLVAPINPADINMIQGMMPLYVVYISIFIQILCVSR